MSQGFQIKSGNTKKSYRHQNKQKSVLKMREIQESLLKHFGTLKDRRVERTKKHEFTDIKRNCNLSNNFGCTGVGRHGKLWYQ